MGREQMRTSVPFCNRRVTLRWVMPAVVSVLLMGLLGTVSVASGHAKKARASRDTTIVYGPSAPTFVGPAATGCASGCDLLTGPFITPSTAPSPSTSTKTAAPKAAAAL